MKKHSLSNGQICQLVHWWLLVHFGQEGGGVTSFAIVVVRGKKHKEDACARKEDEEVFHSTSLLSHMFWQVLSSFQLYSCTKGDELYTSKQNLLF
jgi:hypothetical protein